MRREISSPYTEFYKALILITVSVFPLIMIIITAVTAGHWAWLMLIFVIPIVFFLFPWIYKLCKVEVTESGLIVSRATLTGRKELAIPFEEIDKVSQRILQRGNPETITISSKNETGLGRFIRFIPERRFISFSEHPIVQELKTLAALNTRK